MEPQRDLGLLPIPERRRRRIKPLMIVGAAALVAGTVLDIDFLWGLGAGLLVFAAIALVLDRRARRRLAR